MMIQINTPNFKAKTFTNIKVKNIKQLDAQKGNYKVCATRFVELDPQNLDDYSALGNAVNAWEGQLFAGTIRKIAKEIINGAISGKENHIYFLTTQLDNFEHLNGKKILGMAHMHKGASNTAVLKYLQVLPETRHGRTNREYRDIGKSLISYIKDLYKCNIKVKPYYPAIGFYEKQGFEIVDTERLEYLWKHDVKQ